MNVLANEVAHGARRFPKGFLWGCGTSSYQIEGAVEEDGRAKSIWDVFSHTPGKVHRGDTGDTACDSYHRLERDLELLTELGVNAYRFSIAWPRVQPDGRGAINQRGLDYYRSLIDELRRRDIFPAVTIYHWDLPQVLEEKGGWAVRETAERLAEFAAVLANALGDGIGMWVTMNEPSQIVGQGYLLGTHAPGHRDNAMAAAATHHILLGHGLTVQALRSALPLARIGIALDPNPYLATEPAAEATAAALEIDRNKMYLDPVLHGVYPAGAPAHRLPPDELVFPGDLELIGAPLDFLGLNYYSPHYIRAGDWSDLRLGESIVDDHPGFVEYMPPGSPRTIMDWLVEPKGLYHVLTTISAEAPELPIYITENGCAAEDYVNPEGQVNDFERVEYIHGHLAAALSAIEAGVNVAGYFHWTLMDNFEWAWGYQRRFGLYHVDFGTQRRTAKLSASYYGNIAASGELPDRPARRDDSLLPSATPAPAPVYWSWS